MLTYTYTARESSTGKKIKAELQAESEKAAAKLLKERGLQALEITQEGGKKSPLDKILKRIPTKEKVIFSRQLSTLINAGLPIVQSLQNVSEQTSNKTFSSIINSIIQDVEAGSSFSVALSKYPKVFNNVYISLVAAGETSGTLDVSLERLANQQEKDADIISKVRGAMIYPIIVMVVMMAVVIFMLTTVLPQVQVLYDGLPGAELPLLTKVLLSMSNALINYWWIFIVILVFFAFMFSRWARTGPGKQVIDQLKMTMWPVGPLFVKLYMARFSRTGATLVGSGVPLLQMLGITAEAVNNVHIASSINKAAEKVKGGKSLSEGLMGEPHFPDLVPNMIRIGEQSGAMEAMMGKSADYYEKEVDNQIKAISTLVEPVLMIIMGIVAFLIVAAVLLPIYGLVGHVGVSGVGR
ncbi:type II secretion system F family protein [Candidatus Saccharibacteria bacterium]|nr:type II secretion system F family protein [Candidatus Saccharibacteria bacterium]